MSEAWVTAAADATSLDSYAEGESGGFGEVIEGFHPMARSLKRLMSESEHLNLASKETLGPLETIVGSMELVLGGFMMYRSVKEVVDAVQSLDVAEAAAEAAAALADPAMWGNLALATGTAALAFSAVEFASGQWEFPAIDTNDPVQRAKAGEQLRSVASNG